VEDNSNTSNKKTQFDLDVLDNIVNRVNRINVKKFARSFLINFLSNSLINTETLIQFLTTLFNLKDMNNFETIHLFIHQKGSTKSEHLDISKLSTREYSHDISDFSSFFQSIKKSKNRSFGQSKISGFNLEILGTFLAHEFSLAHYNIILIFSRNDFLPQTQLEISFFNQITSILPSFIEIKLEQSLISTRIEKIKQGLELSPFEFNIDINEINIKRETSHLIDHGDIFHHERVSLLGELLNTLRHELSNPIFGLELTTQLLLLEDHDDEQIIFIEEILKSIKRSQSILENFTHLYKESNEFDIVDIQKLLNEVFTLTKSESRHVNKSVTSNYDSFMLKTNSTWLAQIIFNLVINSSQAMKGIENASLNINITHDETNAFISLQDNGPGIPNNKQQDIFKPFFTTKDQGTGLGLAICHSLAKKLKGSIEYLNSDKGACFLIKLPYENTSN
jgi:two-component system NtrC family sensor kinase